ncbi:patatin-like phospholipase family protein [Microvirga sp. STS02]|uniref:patatin-like phospholipase family protein n=1 Tax=Hymenobacter negativus TaxID=2795026 RepID=UPI0018DE750B|nr:MULTISPECIES: patatin-like phospholipase family protein [Bacteria]MBH8567731.1 patatin-like phospholipase family protein [Hymenobacter negativus]MBR7207465.1 patatin-like phospholipase family protein [Microvirga sp. STS02]
MSTLFDRIALSLSGGGFRASAYSLGTLKALHMLGLLERVHMLSTASGGTITGAYYAMRRKKGDGFAAIYRDFYDFLAQDQLLPHALTQWGSNVKADRPKLIHAFADTYTKLLFPDTDLGTFWDKAPPSIPYHLQTVIFGATELYSGLTFRFQHSSFLPPPKKETDAAYLVGNGNVHLPAKYARQLRLGDVVAASSCFPGGFEPLVLPDDFLPKEDNSVLRGGPGQPFPGSVALLDGGIYDNQGIESLLLANERNAKYRETAQATLPEEQAQLLQPTTLFLVADVSSAEKSIYQAAPAAIGGFSPTLIQAFSAWLVLLTLLGLGAWWLRNSHPFVGGTLTGLALTAVGVTGLLIWGWQRLTRILSRMGPNLPAWVLPRLRQLPLRQLYDLLTLRLGSTKALLTSVFMRRVRSLNYEQLYRNLSQAKDTNRGYETMTSIIGTLVTEHERQLIKRKKVAAKSVPTSVRQQLAAVYPTVLSAQQMPTTLWWQLDIHRLPAIVATAEITLCYQLLRRFEKQPPAFPLETEVQRRAQIIWDHYQADGAGLLPLEALSAQ